MNLLDIHFTNFDVIIFLIVLVFAPLTILIMIILGIIGLKSKSIKFRKWQFGFSLSFLIMCCCVLFDQLQGNYKEEIHLALISGMGIILSIFSLIRLKKLIDRK